MKKTIKYLSLINVLGFSLVSIILILSILIKPFAWSEFLIALNLLISIPFIISGVIILKNIKNPNKQQVQNTLISVFLVLWLPSLSLPFFYETGGFIISLTMLLIGLFGVLKITNINYKMIFINSVGLTFLIINLLVVFNIIRDMI
ncbi:MAG: hypothetical protein AB8B78_10865 [Polaribacter sp.]